MDDGAEQNLDLTQVAGQEIAVPLELRRGVHRVRVTAKTPAGEPGREYFESVTLRYQPPAPTVMYVGERAISVKEPSFDLGAQLLAGAPDEPVKLTISQKVKDQVTLDETKTYMFRSADPLAVSRSLKLEKGRNLVEITAVNQGATETSAEAETSRVAVEINYFKEAGPPVIAQHGIVPLSGGREAPEQEPPQGTDIPRSGVELKIEPDRPIRVNVPTVRILGEVKTAEDEDLTHAKWAIGKEEAKQLTTFEPKKRRLPINEKVNLKPGKQVFRFLAKTATSPEEERTVTVDYQPLVPRVTISSPRSGDSFKGEKESTSIELQASLGSAQDPQPFKPAILLNDRELDVPAQIDPAARTITAKVPLNPGANQLRVKLSNDWGSASVSEEVTVRYLRPPMILGVQPEELKEGVPFASLEVRVRSATPLLAENVHVFVNESERKAQIDIPDKPGEGNVWTLHVTHIPLDANAKNPTTNNIKLRVNNAEAEADKEKAIQVVYQPKQPPPVVEFTQPVDSVSVTRPNFKVQFQVRSETALAQVKLLLEKHEPVAVDVSKAVTQPDGSFLLTAEVPLQLDAGLNTLRIEALNKGGVQDSPPLEINYLYRPVRVAIDSLVAMRPGAKPEKDLQSGGAITVPEGRVRLRGRVLWDEADDQRLQKAKMVRVYVNGFQQLPALLDKPTDDNPRQRTFQSTLVFNRDHDNHIEIALPDLEKDINNRLRLTVHCGRPERSQRLHLLVVSMQDKDAKPLETQIRQAFQTTNGTTTTSSAPKAAAFDPIYSYPSLVDYRVKPSYVYYQLVEIKNTIQRLSQIGAASSDVVAVYYRGGEAINSQGNLFQTSLTRPGRETRESAITCDEVVGIFSETPGAQILLMDVDRQAASPAQDQIISWGEHYPRVGILHYAWLGQPNAPKNPGLIEAIEKAMGQATRLVEVRDGVRRLASASPDFQKKLLVYEAYLPPELEDLSVR
jgi:hypothetical protein